MLWVPKRTVSIRRFFLALKTYVKLIGKTIFAIVRGKKCLSKPVDHTYANSHSLDMHG